jgi:hypothetical protein
MKKKTEVKKLLTLRVTHKEWEFLRNLSTAQERSMSKIILELVNELEKKLKKS